MKLRSFFHLSARAALSKRYHSNDSEVVATLSLAVLRSLRRKTALNIAPCNLLSPKLPQLSGTFEALLQENPAMRVTETIP